MVPRVTLFPVMARKLLFLTVIMRGFLSGTLPFLTVLVVIIPRCGGRRRGVVKTLLLKLRKPIVLVWRPAVNFHTGERIMKPITTVVFRRLVSLLVLLILIFRALFRRGVLQLFIRQMILITVVALM